MTIAQLCERLQAEADEGLFATGGQIFVSVERECVIDVAIGNDGVGQPVGRDTLFAIYCAAKPKVASLVACLVDDGELSLDDRLGDVIEDHPKAEFSSLSIGSLLDHTAGLHQLHADVYLATAERLRDELVRSEPPPPGWRVGTDLAYSEMSAWHFLTGVIEALADGEAVRSLARRRLLDPTCTAFDLFVGGMTDDDYDQQRRRFGINIELRGAGGVPLLIERTRRFRCADHPAIGSSASARGLGRFYEGLLLAFRGESDLISRDTLCRFTAPQSAGFDPIMVRECSYGYGFMVDLGMHRFGECCSKRTFGHSGNGGMTGAFCDPEYDLIVSFHFNGRIDSETALSYRRPSLVQQIYRAVLA